MPTKQTKLTRESLATLATITLSCVPEPEPIEGNASSIDEVTDAETENQIRDQLRRGNQWAWCRVIVTAEYDDLSGGDALGCCSYESEASFRADGYYDSMVSEALDDLWRQLEERTPAGKAKVLAASCRQAITTTYRGPTDYKGSRVIARCEAKRVSVPWDDALDQAQNHAAAALQLMDQLGWSERNDLVMGGTGAGYVFVQVPKK